MERRERPAPITLSSERRGRRNTIVLPGRAFMIWGAMGSAMLFFLLWTIFPLIYTFIYSFYDWQPLFARQSFIGFANYREAFTRDPLFWKALKNTLVFTFANVFIGTFLALGIALMIDSVSRLAAFYRVSFFMPVMISLVAASLVWQFIYQPRFGILNSLIFGTADALGLPPPPEIGWLTRPQWAMFSIILMTFWKFIGFRMVIYLAGLQTIPKTYYEAARIDGANVWQRFRHITFPLLTSTTLFVVVISTIHSLQVFEQMFIMTRGGPFNSTISLVQLLYEKTFELYRFGYGASISFIIFALIFVLTVVQQRFFSNRWEA
jgi:multiple sugar transport system permease protein